MNTCAIITIITIITIASSMALPLVYLPNNRVILGIDYHLQLTQMAVKLNRCGSEGIDEW